MIASPEARVNRSLGKEARRARDFGVYCIESRTGRLKTEEKKNIAGKVQSMDWIIGICSYELI